MFQEIFQSIFQDIIQLMPYETRQGVFFTFDIAWKIVQTWWWIPLPFILWNSFKYHYLYFIQERWDDKIKRVLLEIKMPKEVAKPIKAMEHVFAGLHGIIYDPPGNFREEWIEGQYQLSFSLEIISIEGRIHFYMRVPEHFCDSIKSTIYSQYPDVEIFEVDDYVKNIPKYIPNQNWDIWGADFVNLKDEVYPIKTYKEFEVETEKIEEKKIDPLSIYLENISILKPSEQMWLHIRVAPVHGKDNPWQKRGKELVNKMVGRPGKSKTKSMIEEALEIIIYGPPAKKESSKETFPPEMKLTPGEKEVINAIETKLSKYSFDCSIRFIYIAKKNVFFKPKIKAIFSFLKEITSENLGGLKTARETAIKVKSTFFWFLDKRRAYQKKRKIFRYALARLSPLYPQPGLSFILNTEELATLYHFPSEAAISTLGISRVEIKKKEAPSNLPVE